MDIIPVNREIEEELLLLPSAPKIVLGNLCFPSLQLWALGLEILVLWEGTLAPGTTMRVPLN